MYTCPVAESIFSHFLASPSKEYLWKEIGGEKITYTIPNWDQIPTKQILLCWFYARSLITVVLKERVLGRAEVLQYYSQPGDTDRREAKIMQNKSKSRTPEMPWILQPVRLQFYFPSKWGTWDGTELLVQEWDLSKPHVHLTPWYFPHFGFDGGPSQGLGDRGQAPYCACRRTRTPARAVVNIFCQSGAACNYHWGRLGTGSALSITT